MPDLLTLDYRPSATRFGQHMRSVGQLIEVLGDRATQQSLEDAGRLMDQTVPVDTGRLRRSRTRVHKLRALTWGTEYPLPYATTLEYGGYGRVGPRTMRAGPGELGAGFVAGAGIYSQQAPLGWVRKALAAVNDPWRQRIHAAVRQAWTGQVSTGGGSGETPLTGDLGQIFDIELAE